MGVCFGRGRWVGGSCFLLAFGCYFVVNDAWLICMIYYLHNVDRLLFAFVGCTERFCVLIDPLCLGGFSVCCFMVFCRLV